MLKYAGDQVEAIQNIHIQVTETFGIDNIVSWPPNLTVTSCSLQGTEPEQLSPPYDRPIIDGLHCGQIGISHSDEIYYLQNDTFCFKILRTWKVVNWCDIQNSQWEMEQVIRIQDDGIPEILNCEPLTICDPTPIGCTGHVDITANGWDACTPINSLTISHQVDVNNDNPLNNPVDFEHQATGPHYSGLLPFGEHRVRWSITDACGNESYCDQLLTVIDCKSPTAYCIGGLNITIMPGSGEVPINAEDYDAGSSDNCGDVIFRIIRSADNPNSIPPVSSGLIMNCDDVPGNGVALQVWVGYTGTDLNGNGAVDDSERNWDYCEVLMDVQDPMNVCGITPNTSSVYGVVERESGDPISGMTIEMDDLSEQITQTAETSQDGLFGFNDLTTGNTVQVRPKSGNDYMNGVNTIDLILIQKHILGLASLESRQQKISADVNRDNKISAFDILDLRKLILGIYDELPTNNSWRFIGIQLG